MCGNMYGKQANQQKKKILDEVQMKFYKNRIPSHSIMLYTFSIVTHY